MLEKARADQEKTIASDRSKVIELKPEEIEKWRAVTKPVWKKFEKEIGADLIAAASRSNQ